jgi:lipoprotein-anchoring transpeptidase ErfK/SrfK
VLPFGVAERGLDHRLLGNRRLAPSVALALLVFAIALALAMGHWLEPNRAAGEPLLPLIKPKHHHAPAPPPKPPYIVPPKTWLASPKGEVPTFDAPAGHVVGNVGYYYGYPVTTPILQRTKDFLQIRLPTRPNGSTAWIRATDANITFSQYRIQIHRGDTRVYVYKDGYGLFSMPAGLGKSSTPTPLGSFFVAVIETPGPPGYGPIVLDTSGHSEAIQSWEGSGDAVIAMHGPISSSSDAKIGANGTFISNGCIRLHQADQQGLFQIPLGTPIDILE